MHLKCLVDHVYMAHPFRAGEVYDVPDALAMEFLRDLGVGDSVETRRGRPGKFELTAEAVRPRRGAEELPEPAPEPAPEPPDAPTLTYMTRAQLTAFAEEQGLEAEPTLTVPDLRESLLKQWAARQPAEEEEAK